MKEEIQKEEEKQASKLPISEILELEKLQSRKYNILFSTSIPDAALK